MVRFLFLFTEKSWFICELRNKDEAVTVVVSGGFFNIRYDQQN